MAYGGAGVLLGAAHPRRCPPGSPQFRLRAGGRHRGHNLVGHRSPGRLLRQPIRSGPRSPPTTWLRPAPDCRVLRPRHRRTWTLPASPEQSSIRGREHQRRDRRPAALGRAGHSAYLSLPRPTRLTRWSVITRRATSVSAGRQLASMTSPTGSRQESPLCSQPLCRRLSAARQDRLADNLQLRALHPSPNAGWCEAAFKAHQACSLAAPSGYSGRAEHRPEIPMRTADRRHPPGNPLSRAITASNDPFGRPTPSGPGGDRR